MPVNNRKDVLRFKKSYAFIVGINHYPKINSDLSSAVNDAVALAETLKHRQGFDHVELHIAPKPAELDGIKKEMEGIELTLNADRDNLRNLLDRLTDPELEPKIDPGDCIVFYYAGHGKPGEFEEGPAGYLLPSDAKPDKAMLKNDSLLPMEDLFQALKTLDCHHTLLILDCCFAGKFRHVGKTRNASWVMNAPLYEERFNRYVRERAWQVIVSAGPHQTAADWVGERSDNGTEKHSPFAEALIEALDGKAELKSAGKRHGDGVLTSQELFLYLWDRVESLTQKGEAGFNQSIQYPDLFPMSNHQGGQFIFFDPNNKLNYAERVLRNPYKGLKPFTEKDSDLFFGREDLVKTLLDKLQQTDVLIISAPSGSGKSSLAQAGLIPAIKTMKSEQGKEEWLDANIITIRPGSKPWTGAEAIIKDKDEKEIDRYFTSLYTTKYSLEEPGKKVLLIDQYEDLFIENPPKLSAEPGDITEKDKFEKELISQCQKAAENGLKIIITIRSDYEWMLEESAFGKHLWKNKELDTFLYRLPNMGFDELRKALVDPALAEMYDFEQERLIDRILAEVSNAPGALPMLSFTMSQFYERTDPDERVFKQTTYREMGGVNGALSRYADEVFEELKSKGPDHQEVMKKLVLRMVKINDNNFGRRRVYVRPSEEFDEERQRNFIDEFDYPDHQDAVVTEVLNFLVEKQLIFGGSDKIGAFYEPIHQSLIQHWKTAKKWIVDFGIENLSLQRQLWMDVLASIQPKPTVGKFFDSYGADARDGLKADESLTGKVSKLWASNPKLLQVIGQISYAAKPLMLREKDALIAEALPSIAEEDRATFKKFWDDCYDKEKIPDLNSLILSGYSDTLLEIFLRRGNHWLNEAEAKFIVESWQERIREIMEMKNQRDAFKAAQQRTADEMIETTWKAGIYLPDDPENNIETTTSFETTTTWIPGSRDLYQRLKLLMSLKKARSLSPIPIFVKGPHEEDFDLNATTFGHYNPAFLEWAKQCIIPAKKNKTLMKLTLPFFSAYMKEMARTYYMVYLFLEKNNDLRTRVQLDYQNLVEEGKIVGGTEATVDNSGSIFLLLAFNGIVDLDLIAKELGELAIYNWDVSAGFWVRRHIDGTAALFFEILTDLLQTYDEEWLANPPKLF